MPKIELVKLKLSEIIPYENNPRDNEDAVDDVSESMEQCGVLDPIEVDENNVILSGHTRLKSLYRRGEKETYVIRYKGLTDEKKRKYRLLTNKTGEKAKWDENKLEEELDGLDFDGFDFGFDVFSIDDMDSLTGYNAKTDNRDYFEKTFTFPLKLKAQITGYLKKNYDAVINQIIEKAKNYGD